MRPLITATSLGWCYLLHMSRPLGNLSNSRAQAQHYSGWCADADGDAVELERRIAEHLAGAGARITRAAVAQGIEITLVATWRAPLAFEKHLKRRKDAPRLCPICCRQHNRRPRQITPALAEQLVLPFAEDWIEPADLPPVSGRPSWAEIDSERRSRAAVVLAPVANWDDEI